MSNLFKYKIGLDADSAIGKGYKPYSPSAIPYLASILVSTIVIAVFSAMVMVLNYCFPGSLDGTYLKLFF